MAISEQVCRFHNCRLDKTAAQLLVNSEASMKAIMENPGMSIYSLDREFRYTNFNTNLRESLKAVHGIEIKLGDVIFDFLYKDDKQEADEWKRIYSLALDGELSEFVKEFRVGEYNAFWKFYINPIWEHHTVTGVSCVAIDITRERKAELQLNRIAEDLSRRNQHLEQYAYIIAHNLRAPIANLLGIANLLELPEVSFKDKEEAKSHILGSARRLDAVIRDLSDILEAKEEINRHRESISLENLVRDIKCSIQSVIEKSGTVIEADFSEVSSMITVKAYLHSIFYNLICNAIKFSKPGSRPVIKITSSKDNDRTVLRFEDNGLGIDLQTYGENVFGLYKRFHPQVAEGKGMGLFMVKSQVESLGGEISIESEVDKGSVFTVVL